MLGRTRFVDHINRLIRQFAVVDIARRQFHSGPNCIGCVFDTVVFFEIGLQSTQNFDRIFNRRFVDVDFLETTRQGTVLFKMLTEFFVCC